MSEATESAKDVEEIGELVKSSFPDFRCLRCDHETFYVISDKFGAVPGNISRSVFSSPLMDPEHPVLGLACARCGYVEQHLTGLLRAANKPISKDK